jgi:hypothetical protein
MDENVLDVMKKVGRDLLHQLLPSLLYLSTGGKEHQVFVIDQAKRLALFAKGFNDILPALGATIHFNTSSAYVFHVSVPINISIALHGLAEVL